MNLLSTHDVERLRSVLALRQSLKQFDRAEQLELVSAITPEQDEAAARMQRTIVALLYALPGMPSIYYGDERGLQGGGDPFCRATFPWPEEGSAQRPDCGVDLTDFYQELGSFRKASAALRRGAFACAAPHEDVLCTISVDESSGAVVAAANRSGAARTVAFDASSPELGLPSNCRRAVRRLGPARQVFSSEALADVGACDCEDGIVRVTVSARATVYWQVEIAE